MGWEDQPSACPSTVAAIAHWKKIVCHMKPFEVRVTVPSPTCPVIQVHISRESWLRDCFDNVPETPLVTRARVDFGNYVTHYLIFKHTREGTRLCQHLLRRVQL